MISAYTNLEVSLAAKEMGAEQDVFPQMMWMPPWEWSRSHEKHPASLKWCEVQPFINPTCPPIAALPWLTDDPNEQSILGLLESLGIWWEKQAPGEWRAGKEGLGIYCANSLSILFMSIYKRWKEIQNDRTK